MTTKAIEPEYELAETATPTTCRLMCYPETRVSAEWWVGVQAR